MYNGNINTQDIYGVAMNTAESSSFHPVTPERVSCNPTQDAVYFNPRDTVPRLDCARQCAGKRERKNCISRANRRHNSAAARRKAQTRSGRAALLRGSTRADRAQEALTANARCSLISLHCALECFIRQRTVGCGIVWLRFLRGFVGLLESGLTSKSHFASPVDSKT